MMSVYLHLTGNKRSLTLNQVLTGKHEIGLVGITFKTNFHNIKRNAFIRIGVTAIDNRNGDIRRVLWPTNIFVPEGWYRSLDTLISQIVKELYWIQNLNKEGYDICVDFLTNRVKLSNGFFVVNENTRYICHLDFTVSESIRSFLGLEKSHYSFHTQYYRAKYPLNISSRYYFSISCNQIDTEYGEQSNVLREIPISKQFGELETYLFDEIDFKPLTNKSHRDLTFDCSENIELVMLNVVVHSQQKI